MVAETVRECSWTPGILDRQQMDNLKQSITEALRSRERISRKQVRKWIQQADGVEVDALLYELTNRGWDRIEPRLEVLETCALIQRYLFRCIREDPSDDSVLSRYEAAQQLETWFDQLAGMDDTHDVLLNIIEGVTELFLQSDDEIRRAIETGFLEHVLEQRRFRHYFAHWADDERLQDAWQHAVAWGEAHPDFVKNLRGTFRAVLPRDD
jgi:hypothetical protein